MRIILAMFILIFNFLKAALFSALNTAKVILFQDVHQKDGFARIAYGNLHENTACLLGAMITLTPGTTLIDIDTSRRELVLHLLLLESRETTIKSIQYHFCRHLKVIDEAWR